jgi:DNA invertase Pin-like site-specific DNA recombinase
LKLALQMARDDYEDRRERQRQGIELAKAAGRYAGRTPDTSMHDRITALRMGGASIAQTAKLAGCSESQVKRICKLARISGTPEISPPRN